MTSALSGNFYNSNIALVGFLSTGMIDTSFGMEGWVSTDSFRGLSTASRGALQADGKLLVVGSTSSIPDGFSGGYEHALALARYNVDGSRDTSFGNDGRVVTKYSNGLATEGTDVAVKPDGSILVLGRKSGSFAVSKYLSDGNLDGSFGNQGIRATSFGSAFDMPKAIAIAPTGKIISVGYAHDYAPVFGWLPSHAVISQLNLDGSIDTGFGAEGAIEIQVNDVGTYATSVVVQEDGKILVAGHSEPSHPKLFVARFMSDGSLDTSFGEGGIASYGTDVQFVSDMQVQADGKIVVGGTSATGGRYFATLTRLTANGNLDSTFGDNGVSQVTIGNNDTLFGLAIQSDGKLVISTGSNQLPRTTSNEYYTAGIARLLSDGSLDSAFGELGSKMLNLGVGQEIGRDALIQQDGKILIIGDQSFRASPNIPWGWRFLDCTVECHFNFCARDEDCRQ